MRHDPEEEWNQLSVEQTPKKAVTTRNYQQHRKPRSTPISSRHHVDPSSTLQPNSTKDNIKILRSLIKLHTLYLSFSLTILHRFDTWKHIIETVITLFYLQCIKSQENVPRSYLNAATISRYSWKARRCRI